MFCILNWCWACLCCTLSSQLNVQFICTHAHTTNTPIWMHTHTHTCKCKVHQHSSTFHKRCWWWCWFYSGTRQRLRPTEIWRPWPETTRKVPGQPKPLRDEKAHTRVVYFLHVIFLYNYDASPIPRYAETKSLAILVYHPRQKLK